MLLLKLIGELAESSSTKPNEEIKHISLTNSYSNIYLEAEFNKDDVFDYSNVIKDSFNQYLNELKKSDITSNHIKKILC